MRHNGDVGCVLEREVERGRGTEAEADGADACDALRLELLDDLVDDRLPGVVSVARDPLCAIEVRVLGRLDGARVAVQDVGHDGSKTILGEAVRQELVSMR